MPQIGDYYTGNDDIPSEQDDARRVERARYLTWQASSTRLSYQEWCAPDEDEETVGMTQTDEPERIMKPRQSFAAFQREVVDTLRAHGVENIVVPSRSPLLREKAS